MPLSPSLRRWTRRAGVALGGLLLLAGAAMALGLVLAERKLNRSVDVPAAAIALSTRPDADVDLARGRYLYASRGCVDCHGADGGGRRFLDDGRGLVVAGPNITAGGEAVRGHEPADWARSIRHCVRRDGRPLLVMPCEDYIGLSQDDLASLVAHVRQLPPAAGGAAVVELPLPVRVAYGFGLFKDGAEKVDHVQVAPTAVPVRVDREYGAYVATMCTGCHGAQLAGGRIPGAPPEWPPASDLRGRPGGVLDRYPDASALRAMFRSGRRPDGSAIAVMPFESLRELDDTEVAALQLFLTDPARAAGR